jgi:hypothetical protein
LPALLAAGAFLLPLLSRAVEWLGLSREFRIALPLALAAAALVGVEQTRRGRSAHRDGHGRISVNNDRESGGEEQLG